MALKGSVPWNKGKKLPPRTLEHSKALSISRKGKSLGDTNPARRSDVREKMSDHMKKRIAREGTWWFHTETAKKKRKESRRASVGLFRKKICTYKSLNDQIRSLPHYNDWRSLVFRRDNYTCTSCDVHGVKFHADHIKPFSRILREKNISNIVSAIKCKELWDIINGRTLCIPCHRKTDTFGFKSRKASDPHSSRVA